MHWRGSSLDCDSVLSETSIDTNTIIRLKSGLVKDQKENRFTALVPLASREVK